MKAEFTNQHSIHPDYQNEILEACKKGDHKAQLQVYKFYNKPIYHVCLQITNDPSKAENLMQESFLLASENISTFSFNISFFNWLNTYIKDAYKSENF